MYLPYLPKPLNIGNIGFLGGKYDISNYDWSNALDHVAVDQN